MAAVPELASEQRAPVGRSHRPDLRQGVFETMLVVDGCPVELDAHRRRLASSLEELFPDRLAPELRERVEEQAGELMAGSIRVTVTPHEAEGLEVTLATRKVGPEHVPLTRTGPLTSLSDRKAPTEQVALNSFPLAGGLGPHKWADRSLLDDVQAGLADDALPLVVDENGAVLEASRANVFAVRDGVLVTPPTDGRILPGVTRMRVLEIAGAGGLETNEAKLSGDDLLNAEEVFLTGSVRGIERARSLDGAPLPTGGEVGSRLAAELRRTWLSSRVG
jgi:para-aminobenzoate synthetase / 4-amino-4-deoxychorismate lyase